VPSFGRLPFQVYIPPPKKGAAKKKTSKAKKKAAPRKAVRKIKRRVR
jgi:hypothetical protein